MEATRTPTQYIDQKLYDLFTVEHNMLNDITAVKTDEAKNGILTAFNSLLDTHEAYVCNYIKKITQDYNDKLRAAHQAYNGEVPDRTKKLMSEFGFKDLPEVTSADEGRLKVRIPCNIPLKNSTTAITDTDNIDMEVDKLYRADDDDDNAVLSSTLEKKDDTHVKDAEKPVVKTHRKSRKTKKAAVKNKKDVGNDDNA